MLKIKRNSLLKPLQSVSGIIERRHTLPILSNFLWRQSKNKLVLTATDLEIQVETRIELEKGDKHDEMEATIPARKLLDILNTIPEDADLELNKHDESIKIRTGKSRFNLHTLPVQDYPLLADKPDEQPTQIEISQRKFKKMLTQVDYAMAVQDIRFYLNGLLLKAEKKQIELVGTDGHRLAYIQEELSSTTEKTDLIIPRKAVLELKKLLSDSDIPLRILKTSNQALFDLGESKLITKLVDGAFPDYQRVIPKDYEKNFDIQREDLLHALQRASVLANEKFKGVRWVLSNNLLRVACTNAEQEEAEEELELNYSFEPMDIGFNITYILDVLKSTKEDVINCAVGDENSSMLITLQGNQTFKYVVMPMKI